MDADYPTVQRWRSSSVSICSIRPIRGLYSNCRKMAPMQKPVQNTMQMFVQINLQMVVQNPFGDMIGEGSRRCDWERGRAARMEFANERLCGRTARAPGKSLSDFSSAINNSGNRT